MSFFQAVELFWPPLRKNRSLERNGFMLLVVFWFWTLILKLEVQKWILSSLWFNSALTWEWVTWNNQLVSLIVNANTWQKQFGDLLDVWGSADGIVEGAIINLKINESGKCQRGGGISRRLRYIWRNKKIFYFTVRCVS